MQNEVKEPRYPVKSVGNALRLLLLLHDRAALRVSDASAALRVSPSTAHRLLVMLQHHGFAQQDNVSRAYVSGPALLTLGLSAARQAELRERARGPLVHLAEGTQETAHLAVLDGQRVLFIDSVESHRALRVSSRVGTSMWAHCTSIGKALLAELPDERLLDLYPDEELPRLTDKSLSRRSQLFEQLEAVRRAGYAQNSEEGEQGVGSVGVAVRDRMGRVVAAISTAAPLARFGKAERQRILEATQEAAAVMGADLGDELANNGATRKESDAR